MTTNFYFKQRPKSSHQIIPSKSKAMLIMLLLSWSLLVLQIICIRKMNPYSCLTSPRLFFAVLLVALLTLLSVLLNVQRQRTPFAHTDPCMLALALPFPSPSGVSQTQVGIRYHPKDPRWPGLVLLAVNIKGTENLL